MSGMQRIYTPFWLNRESFFKNKYKECHKSSHFKFGSAFTTDILT